MEEPTKFEKFILIFLVILAIFIAGVQVGIAQGRELQRQGYYEHLSTN